MTEQERFALIHDVSTRFNCQPNDTAKLLSGAYNAAVSDEANALHQESIIVDACVYGLQDYSWRLEQAGLTAFNCTVPGILDTAEGAMSAIIDTYDIVSANADKLMFVRTVEDIYTAKREGKTGVIIGAQNCEFVNHDEIEAAVEVFQRVGLRVMQLSYAQRTFAADGCSTGTDGGLTKDGKRLIRAMERAGVVVDLSHVGRQSSLDAIDHCALPAIFSHSNPDALFPTRRNITDEQAKNCAARGGIIGLNAHNVPLWNGKDFPTIEHYIDAIAYFADLVGIDHVALGIDSAATPGPFRISQATYYSRGSAAAGEDNYSYLSAKAGRDIFGKFIDGLVSCSNVRCVIDKLLKRGFQKEDIQKILGSNWIRVFKQWWK